MSRIVDMWRRGEVPGYSGLYRADDTARAIEIDGAALDTFRVGEPFDLADWLAADPDEVAEIDESARAPLPDGGGQVCCGEGAYGNEGFFARLDAEGELVWVVYLRDGNPFYEIAVDGTRVTFTNNLGRGVTVDLIDELYA
jgi:hypothetical protein